MLLSKGVLLGFMQNSLDLFAFQYTPEHILRYNCYCASSQTMKGPCHERQNTQQVTSRKCEGLNLDVMQQSCAWLIKTHPRNFRMKYCLSSAGEHPFHPAFQDLAFITREPGSYEMQDNGNQSHEKYLGPKETTTIYTSRILIKYSVINYMRYMHILMSNWNKKCRQRKTRHCKTFIFDNFRAYKAHLHTLNI